MSTLFETLPQTIFGPFVAPGADIYAEVLLRLFDETLRHNRPLSRELALAIVGDLLRHPEALKLTQDALKGDDGEDSGSHDVMQRQARAVLRYLRQSGWLAEEQQSDYSRTYILPDYSFRLLWALREIKNQNKVPLAGLICSIHDLLQAILVQGNAHLRLPEAHRQTLYLLNALKELQHNIGMHIEQVLGQLKASAVLDQFFLYRHQIIDRAYHQLRTTDHVSRFRPGILEALRQLEQGEEIEKAAYRMLPLIREGENREGENGREGENREGENGQGSEQENGQAGGVEGAVKVLMGQIQDIRHLFESLDHLLEVIDTRHSQFVDSAVRTVELHLTANTTSSGQLYTIISHLLSEENSDDDSFAEEYGDLLNLFHLELLDADSLAPPFRAAQAFEIEAIDLSAPTEELMREAQQRTLRHLTRAVSRTRVRNFAENHLRQQTSRRAAEIELSGPEELPLLIYLRAYGDGSLGYTIEEKEDGEWIERDGVGFRDFVLRKA